MAMVSGATLDVMRRRSSSRRRKREPGSWRDTESLELAAWDGVLQLRSTVCEGTRDIVQTTRINRLEVSAVDDKGTIKRAKVSKAGETGHRKETVWIYYWRVAHTLISYVSDSYS